MEVYKFGGASVQSAEGVKNAVNIMNLTKKPLIVVVSAMGKTTNALEKVHEAFMSGNSDEAITAMEPIKQYHNDIILKLGLSISVVEPLYTELEKFILTKDYSKNSFDYWYDAVVSYGELLSTTIISAYINSTGVKCGFVDMHRALITDALYRRANINFERSTTALRAAIKALAADIYIMQGFISGTTDGESTTLGREGSDYTAAAVASMLECESVTIWKDVDGILNADPRLFSDTTLIPRLSYVDAVELAYSGAQIIHPKTIKPLENKGILMYVRPFSKPTEAGSVIGNWDDYKPISTPVLILRKNQILLSIAPRDFSFVLEESLESIFSLLNCYNQKVNMIQSSALRISISVDDSRNFDDFLTVLGEKYLIKYNKNLELLTIRGYTREIIDRESAGYTVFVKQQTRRSYKILREQK